MRQGLIVITLRQRKDLKHGLTKNGKPRYLSHHYRRSSRQPPQPNGYTQRQREEILRAYEERSSLRGLIRTFVARKTVNGWLQNKEALLPPLARR